VISNKKQPRTTSQSRLAGEDHSAPLLGGCNPLKSVPGNPDWLSGDHNERVKR
jgi:hypothetical protein